MSLTGRRTGGGQVEEREGEGVKVKKNIASWTHRYLISGYRISFRYHIMYPVKISVVEIQLLNLQNDCSFVFFFLIQGNRINRSEVPERKLTVMRLSEPVKSDH